jgi:Transposase, Mutator family
MATSSMDITSFVGKLLEKDDIDAVREGVRVLAQAVMETEVSSQIGAAPYERSSYRVAYRNGYRTRRWDTRVGRIELKIPKVTAGAYFPSLLEPRRRAERALHAVVVEAYVKGVSTRKVDDLVRALGIDGISRSEVSRICKVLGEGVRRSSVGRSRQSAPTSGSTPPSTSFARPVGWSRWRPSWRSGSRRLASARSLEQPPGRARTISSGPRSCASS